MKKLFKIFCLLFFLSANAQEQFSLFFDSDKFDLKKTELKKLELWMTYKPLVKVIGVDGFCDEDGSNGYNDTLSKKRINYIFDIIKNKIKFRNDFKTRSFGELNNLSKIKAENRKVTLFFIQPKDFSRENEIILRKKIVQNKEIVKPPILEEPKILIPKRLKFPRKLIFENPDGTESQSEMDTLFMQKLNLAKAGEKVTIPNLNFIINTFALVPECRVKLFELLFVMQSNPKLKIELQGHLCCAKNDKQDLSTKRAKSIYNFLVYKEIDNKRLSYKGFGVTMPIFAIPEKDEPERASNRRVEILILEN